MEYLNPEKRNSESNQAFKRLIINMKHENSSFAAHDSGGIKLFSHLSDTVTSMCTCGARIKTTEKLLSCIAIVFSSKI